MNATRVTELLTSSSVTADNHKLAKSSLARMKALVLLMFIVVVTNSVIQGGSILPSTYDEEDEENEEEDIVMNLLNSTFENANVTDANTPRLKSTPPPTFNNGSTETSAEFTTQNSESSGTVQQTTSSSEPKAVVSVDLIRDLPPTPTPEVTQNWEMDRMSDPSPKFGEMSINKSTTLENDLTPNLWATWFQRFYPDRMKYPTRENLFLEKEDAQKNPTKTDFNPQTNPSEKRSTEPQDEDSENLRVNSIISMTDSSTEPITTMAEDLKTNKSEESSPKPSPSETAVAQPDSFSVPEMGNQPVANFQEYPLYPPSNKMMIISQPPKILVPSQTLGAVSKDSNNPGILYGPSASSGSASSFYIIPSPLRRAVTYPKFGDESSYSFQKTIPSSYYVDPGNSYIYSGPSWTSDFSKDMHVPKYNSASDWQMFPPAYPYPYNKLKLTVQSPLRQLPLRLYF